MLLRARSSRERSPRYLRKAGHSSPPSIARDVVCNSPRAPLVPRVFASIAHFQSSPERRIELGPKMYAYRNNCPHRGFDPLRRFLARFKTQRKKIEYAFQFRTEQFSGFGWQT